jgi:DNA-binding NtrC family response regulator
MDKPAGLIGASAAINIIHDQITQAARSNAKVLITGESGVGKEIVARLIHERGSRSRAPLVTINCAGFPDTLLESELFGHVKGSFTDAHRDKRGWLEAAHGGTIFMDEIGEMSLRMQALLLRFLETGEIQRVGSDRALPPLDVRVIAATHRHLADRVGDGSFRQDLYYRLNVVHIQVPPLRERREDVPLLLHYFLAHFAAVHHSEQPDVPPHVMEHLVEYDWPGNVRELRNVAERLVLGCGGRTITTESLPMDIPRGRAAERPLHAGAVAAPKHEMLFQQLVSGGSFWSEVYEPFMARDLTRHELRELVRLGLEHTRGNYKLLVTSFNMRPEDYKRFLNFLRKYHCHVPFQRFRMLPSTLHGATAAAPMPLPRAVGDDFARRG